MVNTLMDHKAINYSIINTIKDYLALGQCNEGHKMLPFTKKAEAGASSFFCLGCLLLWRDSVYCLTLWSTASRTRAVTSYKQCADISVQQHVVGLLRQHKL